MATLKTDAAKRKTLETYALTYINEEIRAGQVVRALDPFRKFLEVAAQGNGKIINFASIASDVGVDEKTVRKYYEIQEDTLIGFFVDAFHRSVRKKVGMAPKFYFFDTGVVRALSRQLTLAMDPGTYAWGNAFEHFVILECKRLIEYSGNQFDLNFLRTYDDKEIDLVVRRPGKALLLVEIKSTENVSLRWFFCPAIQRRRSLMACAVFTGSKDSGNIFRVRILISDTMAIGERLPLNG
ncbi:DUF4143 domain-containing protein [bacterium]|nr:DUF4143 domain-containing protein [bacterium]